MLRARTTGIFAAALARPWLQASHRTRRPGGSSVRSFRRSRRARNLTAKWNGQPRGDDPMHAWAKAPDEMAQRIEENLSQLDGFGLGGAPLPLLARKRPPPKKPPVPPPESPPHT